MTSLTDIEAAGQILTFAVDNARLQSAQSSASGRFKQETRQPTGNLGRPDESPGAMTAVGRADSRMLSNLAWTPPGIGLVGVLHDTALPSVNKMASAPECRKYDSSVQTHGQRISVTLRPGASLTVSADVHGNLQIWYNESANNMTL